jgi:hypothetical protein
MRLTIPKNIKSNLIGYTYFAQLYADTSNCIAESLLFDFNECELLEGNLCAVFGGILYDLQYRGNAIAFINVSDRMRGVFSRNRFLNIVESINIPKTIQSTTIYYNRFSIEEEKEIKRYVQSELLDKRLMPEISDLAKKKILEAIFEIFVNATTHGETSEIFTCGEFFDRPKVPYVYFTFVDFGRSIRTNVSTYLNREISAQKAIEWAVTPGNTTKTGNHSGGLGLKIIQDFIEINTGKMHIVSAEGLWELERNVVKSFMLPYSFPGTIITLAINLDKTKSFMLKEEDVKDIVF